MLKRETLKLLRTKQGETTTLSQCVVGNGNINSKDIKTPIEAGDKLIRLLPSGIEEIYLVIDVIAFTNVLPHYEIKVKKV